MKHLKIVFLAVLIMGGGIVGMQSLSPLHATTPPSVVAFPGAEGFGADSVGGRYGSPTVYVVNTLLDEVEPNDGLTSLREAVEAQGPRFVVFSVGGVIVLDQRLMIKNPYITIAGQTAPSPGITLAHYGICIDKGCHDVIIRYLRFRGFYVDDDIRAQLGSILLASSGDRVDNIIIDHCSMAWSHDEAFLAWGNIGKFTLQWSYITEACGWHETGTMLSTALITCGPGCQEPLKASIHHNLIVHNKSAMPDIQGGNIIDFRNNVVYNWLGYCVGVSDRKDAGATNPTSVNFVNNYYMEGKELSDVTENKYMILVPPPDNNPNVKLYMAGNLGPLKPYPLSPEWGIGNILYLDPVTLLLVEANLANYGSTTPATAPNVNTTPSTVALYHVLARGGMVYPVRDSLDTRIVNEVQYLTANYGLPWNPLLIDVTQCVPDSNLGYTSPNEGPIEITRMRFCGVPYQFPVLTDITALTSGITPGTPPLDSDDDGIPDQWETQHGLNPFYAGDSILDRDGDGYLNIEEYFNSLVVDSSI